MLRSRVVAPVFGFLACGALVALVSGCPGTTGGGNGNAANGNTGGNTNTANMNAVANMNTAANMNTGGLTGNAANGMTLYMAGGGGVTACTNCHAANGVGGAVASGADLTNNTTADSVETGMRGVAIHSGFVDMVTDQNFADLAAFFATL